MTQIDRDTAERLNQLQSMTRDTLNQVQGMIQADIDLVSNSVIKATLERIKESYEDCFEHE